MNKHHSGSLLATGSALAVLTLLVIVGAGRGPDALAVDEPHRSDALHFAANDGDQHALFSASRHLAKIASHTNGSVVHIQSERDGRSGVMEETGSGVILTHPRSSQPFIVTNRHVIQGATCADVSILLHDGRIIHPASMADDAATDLAVLRLQTPGLSPAAWGDSDRLEIGHMVLAVGSPFGLSRSITFGIVSAKGRRSLKLGANSDVINQDFLQTDAAINPGNSGGPLIDLSGRVVGINTAIASASGGNEGIGFSIPSNLVRRVVSQLIEHGKVQRAYLGVRLDDEFDSDAAKRLSLDRVRGARVTLVYPKTPAALAELQIDDVVLTFDGHEVEDENHLIHLVSLTDLNRPVRMLVLRNRRRVNLEVTLIDRERLNRAANDAPTRQTVPARPSGYRVPRTGLSLAPLDESLARRLGFAADQRGLLVMSADKATTAAGLKLYDVIVEVDRDVVAETEDADRLRLATDASPLLLKVRRLVDGHMTDRLLLWSPSDGVAKR